MCEVGVRLNSYRHTIHDTVRLRHTHTLTNTLLRLRSPAPQDVVGQCITGGKTYYAAVVFTLSAASHAASLLLVLSAIAVMLFV